MHPDTVTVEQALGVFVTVTVPVWHTDIVEVEHKVGEVLKDPVAVEDKHKVGEVLREVVGDEDPVMVPEVQ